MLVKERVGVKQFVNGAGAALREGDGELRARGDSRAKREQKKSDGEEQAAHGRTRRNGAVPRRRGIVPRALERNRLWRGSWGDAVHEEPGLSKRSTSKYSTKIEWNAS